MFANDISIQHMPEQDARAEGIPMHDVFRKDISAHSISKLGIGWRPELAVAIERRKDLGFVEIVAENWSVKEIPEPLVKLHKRGTIVIPHGVSLSLGGASLPDLKRIRRLNDLAQRFDSPFVSEHIAFVRGKTLDSGHLLPVPRTRSAVKVLVENITFCKQHLAVPLVLENIAYLCDWKNSELDEAEFVTEILETTDSMMLLDVANLMANSLNHNFDAVEFLKKIPLQRIAYVHVAGGIMRDGLYHDTHAHPVSGGVHELLARLCELRQPPMVMLERDDAFPQADILNAELDAIKFAISGISATSLTAYECSKEISHGVV